MAVKIMTLLLEMSTSQYWAWVFGIFSMIVQSDVKRSLCFTCVLFITYRAFHQVNNVLTFAVNLMIDFKFSFCLINLVVDVNCIQYRLPVFDKYGEHMPVVYVFFARLTSVFDAITSN